MGVSAFLYRYQVWGECWDFLGVTPRRKLANGTGGAKLANGIGVAKFTSGIANSPVWSHFRAVPAHQDQCADIKVRITLMKQEPDDGTTLNDCAGRPTTSTLVLLIVLTLIAMAASAELVLSEIQTLKHPAEHLGCDLNPLIGCSASLTTWQAHLLFGIPNALVGVGLFAGLAGVFLAWCSGQIPRWLGVLIEAGLTGGMVLIAFFLHQSIFEFTKLCPFCFIVWTCTIILWVQLGAALMRLDWLFPGTGFARIWTAQRWLITAIILLLIVLVVAVTLSDKLVYLF